MICIMINPWKDKSGVNPQKEKGSRRIATDFYVALNMVDLTATEIKVVNTVINFTWGFNRLEAPIGAGTFEYYTGKSIPSIRRAIITLEAKNILIKEAGLGAYTYLPKEDRPYSSTKRVLEGKPYSYMSRGKEIKPPSSMILANIYMINKYYDTWEFKPGSPMIGVEKLRPLSKWTQTPIIHDRKPPSSMSTQYSLKNIKEINKGLVSGKTAPNEPNEQTEVTEKGQALLDKVGIKPPNGIVPKKEKIENTENDTKNDLEF
jgi:hypothetical protein